MPRVVPSQIVAFIDELFPQFHPGSQGRTIWVNLNIEDCYRLQGVLGLIDQMPPEMIVLNSREYSAFVCSVSAIRTVMANPKPGGHGILRVELPPIPAFDNINPVAILRDLLSKCPDEFPGTDTSGLDFIPDTVFRESLRNDLAAVNRALTNNEWKAATVLGGSVIEALLLSALQRQPPEAISEAVDELSSSNVLKKKLDVSTIDAWHLPDYIEVALKMTLIRENTAIQLRLAKDFRNLIHPGRSTRLGQVCNRGTAFAGVAGIEFVIEDLS